MGDIERTHVEHLVHREQITQNSLAAGELSTGPLDELYRNIGQKGARANEDVYVVLELLST
jgi:hypothetical protein